MEKEPAPRKRQKTAAKDNDTSEDLSSPLSDVDSEIVQDNPKSKQQRRSAEKPRPTKPKPKPSAVRKAKAAHSSSDEAALTASKGNLEEDTAVTPTTDDGSESELSVLMDEAPPPTKKRKQKATSISGQKATNKKTTKPAAKGKADAGADPDQAEIKRLQGWLVKCGIRKLWGKELKAYETPKAKIKHLKDLLAEVGMTGRYSVEKANQIKEARELAADIEAVQEGAERWGADEDEEQDGKQDSRGAGPGARRLVRGAKNYDFLSSDGEETD